MQTPQYCDLISEEGDRVPFLVPASSLSGVLENLVLPLETDEERENGVPLPNITTFTLQKVVEYMEYHYEFPVPQNDFDGYNRIEQDVKLWDEWFIAQYSQSQLFEIILAANYLDIQGLLDATCRQVAEMIKGKSPEEIRTLFNIQNDFTPEEEEQVRRENEWCMEE